MFTRWRIFAALVEILVAICLLPVGAHAQTDHPDGYRLSGPVSHGNLAIYFVHGASRSGPVPLTLQEAMEKKVVEVREIGRVNEVLLENVGDEEVFIQAGDIVKGGQQDRVLSVSLMLPPRSGAVSVASYCVESGRWSARGGEDYTCSQAPAPSCRRAGPSSKWRQPQPGRQMLGAPLRANRSLAERRTDSRQAVEHSGQFGCGTSLADEPAIVAGERPPRARAGAVSRRAQAAG